MDWTPKTPFQWDWETFALFTGKENEISKSFQEHDWKVEGGVLIDSCSTCPLIGAYSVSVTGNDSSKSSISASFDSSLKAERKISELNFESTERSPTNLSKVNDNTKAEDTGTSPLLATTSVPHEPLIGLKLGKRTYFEDSSIVSKIKNFSSTSAPISIASVKKSNLCQKIQSSTCQVEGCNVDLSTVKEYHCKHKVCESHSKCPKVIVGGQERRFCQQCSRFHALTEFDQKKRSCRRSLSDHNARRRKPPPETISFSPVPSAMYYVNERQMNFIFSRDSCSHVTTMGSSASDCLGGFKLSERKEPWIKSAGQRELNLTSTGLSDNASMIRHDLYKLLLFKGTTDDILDQSLEASAGPSNFEEASDLQRVLSLLSTDLCGSANLGPTLNSHIANAVIANAAQHELHDTDAPTGFWPGN